MQCMNEFVRHFIAILTNPEYNERMSTAKALSTSNEREGA